jgi:hypothetical protein
MEKLALFGVISIVVISFMAVIMTSAIESSTANAAFNFYDYELGASSYAGPKVYGGAAKKFEASKNWEQTSELKELDAYQSYLAFNPDLWTCGISKEVADADDDPCFDNDDKGYCCIIND